MTLDEIRANKPDGATHYCKHPITIYDKAETYLKKCLFTLLRWSGSHWEVVCFPYSKNDLKQSSYIAL